jgi:hypothetical protein
MIAQGVGNVSQSNDLEGTNFLVTLMNGLNIKAEETIITTTISKSSMDSGFQLNELPSPKQPKA